MDINHIDDSPPVAAVRPEGVVVDNRTFIDDYRWLSDKGSPEVQTYLRAENAYTKSVMRRAMPFVEKLYKEIMDRTKQTDVSVPIQCGDYFYYRRIEAGKQYPIYCRR